MSSATGSDPTHTSTLMPTAVVTRTALSTHMVGAIRHGRNP